MTVETTGQTVLGMIDGMTNATSVPTMFVSGNPDGVVTSIQASGVAFDVGKGIYYIAKTTNGSTWYNLGSVAGP